jgi:type II secretory pathway pseudopilin PulG
MRSGQTLIEAIIAVAIIGVALIGFLSQATFNMISAKDSINRSFALNLAREGVEVVRHVRDSNWLQGCFDPADTDNCSYWNTGLSDGKNYRARPDFDSVNQGWELSFVNYDFDDCVERGVCRVYKDRNGFYAGLVPRGDPSDYYRMVEILPLCKTKYGCGRDDICNSGESCPVEQIGVHIISHVRWFEGRDARNITLQDKLYNWR